MRLYLGTNNERGSEIVKERILSNVNQISNTATHTLGSTITNGFVYLTDLVSEAIYYGNKAELAHTTTGKYYVFEIEINESELLPDVDKLAEESKEDSANFKTMPTWESSLQQTHSIRVARDLALGTDVIGFAILPVSDDSEHVLSYITKDSVDSYRTDHNTPVPASVEEIVWQDFS